MIWILVPLALGSCALVVFGTARALPVLVSALPGGEPERGVPRPGTAVEGVLGLVIALALGGALLTVPGLLDPRHPDAFYPITPIALGASMLVAALIAGGPRGRARLKALLFVSNRRYVGLRTFVITNDKSRRLAEVGRAPALVGVLLVGALVALAAPLVSRSPAPAASMSPALAGVPEDMREMLEAGIAAGDPEALAVAGALGIAAPSGPQLEEWTSERELGWTLAAAALAGLAALLVLSPGGLSRRETRTP